jgi:pSer/pThr/pTyr-binding forkhead associated (FHA) protein
MTEEAQDSLATVEEPVSTEIAAGTGAKLVLKRGGVETDVEFPFTSPAIVGRFDPAVGPIDIDLGSLSPEGGYISRKHAKIVFEDGSYRVKDLGSSNGTYVLRDDFERVDDAELADGQELAFGNARFVFHLVPDITEDEPLAEDPA